MALEQQIIDYILQAQKHGLTDVEIKQNLLNAGWQAGAVEENFVFARAAESKPPAAELAAKPQVSAQPTPLVQPAVLRAVEKTPTSTPAEIRPAPVVSPVVVQSPIQPQIQTAFVEAKPPHKHLVLAVVVILLLCVGGAAFGYYHYYYNTLSGVWKRLATAPSEPAKVYKMDYDLSYNFKYKEEFEDNDTEKPGSLGLKGTLFKDLSNPNESKMSNELNLVAKAGSESYNFGISFIVINKILYVDLGRVQFLKELIPGEDLGWIKVDFDSLAKYAEEKGTKIDNYKNPFDQASGVFGSSTFNELVKANVIKPGTFFGKEKIGEVPVYHFKNEFDKDAFLPILLDLINKNLARSNAEKKTLTDEEKKVISALVRKTKVKELETWVGQKDFQLYKTHLVISAPSVSDFENSDTLDFGPFGQARAQSRDAKRLSDVRQFAYALELYYNDFGGYPAAEKGEPIGLAPNYFGELPKAPTPLDGTCTDYYNSYWYEPAGLAAVSASKEVNVYPSYSLTFCLGQDSGGYEAGIGKLTPQGIEQNIACPGAAEDCVNPNPQGEMKIETLFAKWKFDAEIKFESTYKDIGKTENVVAPADAKDLVDLIKNALGDAVEKSEDAKRLTDIRMLATALELYFNDKSAYPNRLDELAPNYIGLIPTPPPVVAGVCTAQDNEYNYTFISAGKYTLTFCLGHSIGGYSAGRHTLTEAGIN